MGVECGEGAMGVVRLRGGEAGPPAVAARPVEAPHLFAADERAVRDRFVAAPGAAGTAVVRDAGAGAAAGSGQDHEATGVAQHLDERPEFSTSLEIGSKI